MRGRRAAVVTPLGRQRRAAKARPCSSAASGIPRDLARPMSRRSRRRRNTPRANRHRWLRLRGWQMRRFGPLGWYCRTTIGRIPKTVMTWWGGFALPTSSCWGSGRPDTWSTPADS